MRCMVSVVNGATQSFRKTNERLVQIDTPLTAAKRIVHGFGRQV
jgi:hypothetical protein